MKKLFLTLTLLFIVFLGIQKGVSWAREKEWEDCDGPATQPSINEPKVREQHLQMCKQELAPELQADSSYYVVWGILCNFKQHCTEADARDIADFRMRDMLKEQYGELIDQIHYTTEEIYIKSEHVIGGWYVTAVAIRVKKEDIENTIFSPNKIQY